MRPITPHYQIRFLRIAVVIGFTIAICNASALAAIGMGFPRPDTFNYEIPCANPRMTVDERIEKCSVIARSKPSATDPAFRELARLFEAKHEFETSLGMLGPYFDYAAISGDAYKLTPLELRSEIYAAMGHYEDAFADVSEITRIDRDQAQALGFRCWIRAVAGRDLELGLSDCAKATELKGQAAGALVSRGLIYFKLGRFQESLADYEALLAFNKKLAPAQYMKGCIERRIGNAAQGDADIAFAAKSSPIVPGLMSAYGVNP